MINIMDKFQRSWDITKLTFSILKKDKTMLLFPVMSSIFSILFIVMLIVPFVILSLFGITDTSGIVIFSALFVVYFGLAFLATFFNVCVVFYTKKTFRNEPVSFKSTLSFGFSNLKLIFYWALVSATVSVLIRILENATRRMGGIGQIISRMLLATAAMGWAIATVFVIPSIVYNKRTPFDAIKESVQTLKKTWGESLIRYAGLNIIQFIVTFIGVIILGGLTIVSFMINLYLGLVMLTITILFVVIASLVFQVANDIFNTALFEYAQNGSVPNGYNQKALNDAFVQDTTQRF
ncbi:MAG: DUF6159 family protein [Nanoarchaeota archaeon]|nr:DUF6159 family protein [Nanoarchaeota archaeon]